MKKLLLMLYLFLFLMESVFAKADVRFYFDDEVVEEMWITRVTKERTISDHPYILKRKSDNTYVYCLEPVTYLNQTEDYTPYFENEKKLNLTEEQWERISLLAYFGYLYPGHEKEKWYGVTQYMIWKTVVPDMTIYFASAKNGKKITAYEKEMQEIENLILDYQKLKELDHQVLEFTTRKEWEEYREKNTFLKNVKETRAGGFTYELPKNEAAFGADIVYYHKSGQNVYHPGELDPIGVSFKVQFKTGRISLQKKKEEGVFTSSLSLEGATYGIYQEDGTFVEEIVTDKEGKATSSPLEYGTYIIKELKAPYGYTLEKEEYTIELDASEYPLEVVEKQIQKEISIRKWYGSGTYRLEANATFEIYEGENLLFTVTTDSKGIAKFSLPYGEYRVHQVSGKKGYAFIEDTIFQVNEKTDSLWDLYNEEIIEKVPDTGRFFFFSIGRFVYDY